MLKFSTLSPREGFCELPPTRPVSTHPSGRSKRHGRSEIAPGYAGLRVFSGLIAWMLLGAPAGAAISDLYPNDVGIRNHPSVIYATGFDSPNWKTTDFPTGTQYYFYGGSDPNNQPQWTSLDKMTGAGSLVHKHLTGTRAPGGLGIMGFTGRDEIYMRWHRKYQTGFKWECQVKNNGVYAVADPNNIPACVRPTGYDRYSFRATDEPNKSGVLTGDHSSALYFYHPNDNNNGCGEWMSPNQGSMQYRRSGIWHSYEIYLKANTVGQFNGVIKLWVDGVLIGQRTDIEFRKTSQLKINNVYLFGNLGGDCLSTVSQSVYDDNLVLATEYIGPMATAPLPPTGLTVK